VLTFDYYRVKPGDTLSTIAKRYDSDVRRIASANNLNKSNFIVAGKKLKIPRGLYPLELEQYELAIEEQAYPFEEKAIHVHEKNLKLISRGVYNVWVQKSLQKLAQSVPARYDKPEENSGIVSSPDTYIFEIDMPALAALPASESGGPVQIEESGSVTESEPEESAEVKDPGSVGKTEPGDQVQTEKPGPVSVSETAETEKVEEPESVEKPELLDPVETDEAMPGSEHESTEAKKDTESGSVTKIESEGPLQTEEPEPVTVSKTADRDQGVHPSLPLTRTDQGMRR
jgi:LysM repeat protein